MIWTFPKIEDIADFAKKIGCSWIGAIPIAADASCDQNQCHTNVKNYIKSHGGERILGYYFLESPWGFQAILHSVWCDNSDKLIDITPFADDRKFNIFSRLNNNIQQIKTNNIYSQTLDKYSKQESEVLYYIYALIDPRNNMPFYIGKGKGRRAKTHLWDIPETRNIYKENKIASIRQEGLEPKIEYLFEDIIDEDYAYKIETDLITRFGRKGYESYGILTNVCIDSKPPNHKGKTYEEIYGSTRAQLERQKRAELQKARGGYGPKKHTAETCKKISEKSSGSNNAMFGRKQSLETIKKIIENRTLPKGEQHYLSKHWVLISPEGIVYEQVGNLQDFCQKLKLNFSTIRAAYRNNRIPNKGNAKGWKITTKEKGLKTC